MNFDPQQLAALLGTGVYDDQDRDIQQQLAQAYALRNRPHDRHSTGSGAALGGIGNMLNTARSHQRENDLRTQQQAMQQHYIDVLRQLSGGAQPGPGMPPTSPGDPGP